MFLLSDGEFPNGTVADASMTLNDSILAGSVDGSGGAVDDLVVNAVNTSGSSTATSTGSYCLFGADIGSCFPAA